MEEERVRLKEEYHSKIKDRDTTISALLKSSVTQERKFR